MTNHYEIIHDNLNNQWLLADLSNVNYKFFYKIDSTDNYNKYKEPIKKKKKKLSSLFYNLFI